MGHRVADENFERVDIDIWKARIYCNQGKLASSIANYLITKRKNWHTESEIIALCARVERRLRKLVVKQRAHAWRSPQWDSNVEEMWKRRNGKWREKEMWRIEGVFDARWFVLCLLAETLVPGNARSACWNRYCCTLPARALRSGALYSRAEIHDVTSAIHALWICSCSLLHLSLLSLSSSHALLGPLISHCS